MRGYILAIDQGTTNTKALLVGRDGQPAFRASVPLALQTPQSGFVEQDPEALWNSVLQVVRQCVAHAGREAIQGIAISNQRETALAWSRSTGQCFANAVSWQCRRGETVCTRLRAATEKIRTITGLPLDPLLSATKWAWLLEHNDVVRAQAHSDDLCFGTIDSWLVYKLTGGASYLTDHTNASRTALMNLVSLDWDDELLALFCIRRSALPHLTSSSSSFGSVSSIPEIDGVPIVAAIGDSHAAMVGHGSYGPGSIKATYGTGSSLMSLTRAVPSASRKLARTVAWSVNGVAQYALEGNIAMTGSAVQWVGQFLGLADPVADAVALSETVPDSNGVYLVPAMVGLGAPHWDSGARGILCGLGRSSTRAHMARAAVEAIAYQIADVFHAMQESLAMPLSQLHTDGGATRNDRLMQFQADLLQVPVQRSACEDLSALGAAWLGGITLGWWKSIDDLCSLPQQQTLFTPVCSLDSEYNGWKQAVDRARSTEAVR